MGVLFDLTTSPQQQTEKAKVSLEHTNTAYLIDLIELIQEIILKYQLNYLTTSMNLNVRNFQIFELSISAKLLRKTEFSNLTFP